MRRWQRGSLIVLVLVLALALPAWADVTIETAVKSIKVGPAPASQFEVPGDFVKQ